jgi:two-component system, sensor histidine kinase LadS
MKIIFSKIIFLSVIFCTNIVEAQIPIILNQEKDWLLVGKQTYFLEDKTCQLNINDVLKAENQTKFQLIGQNIFTHLPTTSKFWLKLTVHNRTGKEAWLAIESTYLWEIDYFSSQNGHYKLITQTGSFRPETNKAYPSNVFWLPLGTSQEIQTVYVAIYTRGLIEVPIKVGTILSLSQEKLKNDYLFAGFIGIMLIMVAYNLFLLFATRDKVYIPYLAYVITSIYSASFLNNYTWVDLIISPQYKYIPHQYCYAWLGVPLVFAGYFAIYFLNLKKKSKFFLRSIQLNMFIFGLVIPIINLFTILPMNYQAIFYQIATLFYAICLLSVSFYLLIIKKEQNALFYTIGWVWAISGVLVYLLSVNGMLPYHLLTRNSIFIGVSLEILFFSLALGNRINNLRKQKVRIQAEKQLLLENQKAELEKQVNARTLELKETNEELKIQSENLAKANTTKDKLFAIISHDLRAPISNLHLLLDLVISQELSIEDFMEVSKELKKSAEYVDFTLNNLLQWANNQVQNIKPQPKKTNLKLLGTGNFNFLGQLAATKQIEMSNQIDPNLEAFVDPDQINLVFRNLISNAIKFTPKKGSINLQSKTEIDFCEIAICDTGVGMNAENVAKLFNKTTHFITYGTSGEKGTGLGLLLCQEMIEKNGGTIWAESEVGKGATFKFRLPL